LYSGIEKGRSYALIECNELKHSCQSIFGFLTLPPFAGYASSVSEISVISSHHQAIYTAQYCSIPFFGIFTNLADYGSADALPPKRSINAEFI
jgi:hypothetical protein